MDDAPPHLSAPTPDLPAWFDVPGLDAWRAEAERLLRGRPVAKLTKPRLEGFDRRPLYTPADAVDTPAPDAAPYRRGSRVLDRRQAGWDIRALVDAGSLDDARAALAAVGKAGARSVWLVPDRPGRGLVGDGDGLPVRDADALGALLADVDLASTPIHVEAGQRGATWLAGLRAAAVRQGVAPAAVTGSVAADPMGDLARTGRLPVYLQEAWDDLAGVVRGAGDMPWVHLLAVSGLPWAEAGADAATEVGLMLAGLAETLRAMEARGIDPETVATRTLCQVSVGRDTFDELAKLRALRVGWAKVLGACGCDAEHQRAFVHAVTSRALLTTRDPWVNLLRTTHGAFVAALAGADAITMVPWDRALGVPDAAAHRAAVTSQHVLEAESHLARVADPAGGSWAVETLTDQILARAWQVLQEVEAEGGLVAALASGAVQKRLFEVAAARDAAHARRKRGLVGVSVSANPTEERPPRTPAPVSDAARPETVSVVAVDPVPLRRDAAPWEALRDAADLADGAGARPTAFLANLGALARHKARADFARGVLHAGGLAVVSGEGSSDPVAIAEAFRASGAGGAVVCGHDADYVELVPAVAAALRDAGAAFVVLAGRPGEHEAAWREAGLTHAVFLGADVLALLKDLHRRLGVTA